MNLIAAQRFPTSAAKSPRRLSAQPERKSYGHSVFRIAAKALNLQQRCGAIGLDKPRRGLEGFGSPIAARGNHPFSRDERTTFRAIGAFGRGVHFDTFAGMCGCALYSSMTKSS
jgi:hypothetical protein